jgi:hypothetical protein
MMRGKLFVGGATFTYPTTHARSDATGDIVAAMRTGLLAAPKGGRLWVDHDVPLER